MVCGGLVIALIIKSNKQLEELQLYNNDLQSSYCSPIIEHYFNIKMSYNQITHGVSEALASAILHNRELKELHIN